MNRIEHIVCLDCKHNQEQDPKHPQTFHCEKCGKHFNYRVTFGGKYEVTKKGRTPLPENMRKKTVSGVREYKYIETKLRAAGYTMQQAWDAGIVAILGIDTRID
jgi:hypothetical protein